ncbi:MAG TPA: hypothetical protein P5293_01995 [Bacteroidales bacterium]|nr:hypothetical protein [Bacteroidales bacterium]
MKQLEQKNLDEIMAKMFEMAGATYDPSIVKKNRWYLKYRWTKAQEESFKKWLVSYLKKNKFCLNTKIAEKQADYFILWTGFPTSDFEKK